MDVEKIRIAIDEAQRFILAAKLAYDRLKKDNYAMAGCKETGSAKRASMDLTRALAEMRKSKRWW